ncbi:Crp/Fnr family transcriptional regulator [Microvirga terricola]|uniref:Helix-turn-helix domain-containing protein n=1 Tax=Microvirga terricola TaxID=2719797 RepID=A0ABX0VE59_9HYPH|nr:helix-turn-helix domain-containing protein [Microvirga terricola]NIX78113.1 helix-turn-helix domain-containing protein [Microvirga terricola]
MSLPYRDPCKACLNCDVRRKAVCSALKDDEVGELERVMSFVKLEANQILLEEGEPRRRVYSLTSGMLRLSLALPDGRRQITGFLMPGDFLGLADDDTYSQTAEAVIPSGLCSFSVRDMDQLMERFPHLKDRLHLMTRAALRQARETQMILGRLAPSEKVASFLLIMSNRAAAHGLPESPVHLPMTRTDIADYLGLTIETVSRTFTKLKTQGLIHLPDPHSVEIADKARLATVAGITLH